MMQKIRPLFDRVLVKRLAQEEKTAGGIIIPDVAKEKGQTGKVVAVGTGKIVDGKTTGMQVKVNDIILFGKYAGTETDQDYIIINQDEILGVIEE